MDSVQRAALQAMTPADKFRLLGTYWHMAWRLKAAYLRSRHPDWPESRIEEAVRRIFIHAGG